MNWIVIFVLHTTLALAGGFTPARRRPVVAPTSLQSSEPRVDLVDEDQPAATHLLALVTDDTPEQTSPGTVVSEGGQDTTSMTAMTTDGISTTNSTDGVASASKGPTPTVLLSRWKRRLNTKEDPFSLHKLACIAYTLSAFAILATAALRYFDSPEAFAEVHLSLELPTYIFTVSNVIVCASSVRMAFIYRRNDLANRNAFLGAASSSMFTGFSYLWTSPLGPEILNNQVVTQICFAVLTLLNAVLAVDTITKLPEVLESRRDHKSEDYAGRFWVDVVGYILPVAWPLPFLLISIYLVSSHSRVWYFEQCQYIDEIRGVPGMIAEQNYLFVASCLGASFGALFPTLRDKKLISKNHELGGITAFSVPAMILTVLTSADFIGYLLAGKNVGAH